ncbi:hypothetical protein [Streptomyces ehimensis]|uniref:Uncharacterized protein n=1 Tax=Streptomyces ehimensis TaxID=68195 RepID=A0ABV9BUJ8_9ACTN
MAADARLQGQEAVSDRAGLRSASVDAGAPGPAVTDYAQAHIRPPQTPYLMAPSAGRL